MLKREIYRSIPKIAIVGILVAIIFPSSLSIAYAKDGDIWSMNKNIGGIGDILLKNRPELFRIIRNISSYDYEIGGKIYNAKKVNDEFDKLPNSSIEFVHSKVKETLISEAKELPLSSGESETIDPSGKVNSREEYEAVLKNALENFENKVLKNDCLEDRDIVIDYPVANGEKYTYENLDITETDSQGNIFENTKTVEELERKIKSAIENKEETLLLKVYNLNMNQQELLNKVKSVIINNSGMTTNGLRSYSIISSGDSIKLVKYSFIYK